MANLSYSIVMDANFFKHNREQLARELNGGLVVLSAYTKMQLTGDTAAVFKQEANFWYLTGINQPDWRLIVDGKSGTSWLIAPTVDAIQQLFDGALDYEKAQKISGVDEVLTQEAGERLLYQLARQNKNVYTLGSPSYADHVDFVLNPAPQKLYGELARLYQRVEDCRPYLMIMRAIKQPVELDAMKKAADISVEAVSKLERTITSCRFEYEAEAELIYCYRRQNAAHAFDPIVAAGKNACTLHYIDNAAELRSGQLLLVDTGALVAGYPSDITRTFAVGEPTPRQREVHDAVRLAQQRIVGLLEPGLPLKTYSSSVRSIMGDALVSLGLMIDKNDKATLLKYFPHAVSHGIGVEVHESLGNSRELKPGMVLTVEPGVYIPEEEVGVRIEDTVAITEDGSVNLTGELSTDL